MSKEIVYIACQPDDLYFCWQLETQIWNFRKHGISDKLRYLMFLPSDRLLQGWNPKAKELVEKYPEVQFFWYEDKEDILVNYIHPYQYIPLLRPYCLAMHFKEHPELEEKTIFYLDADVIFTKYPDFVDKYKDDDICYLSDTKGYIAASYWNSKENDVKEGLLEKYKEYDPLEKISSAVGINRAVCEMNENGSGGAQYLLKGIDYNFWLDVFRGCLNVRGMLSYHIPGSVNKLFFESEEKGFQSWAADMWAVLWNLWKRGKITECPSEMNFVWATSPIEQLEGSYIMHNAGATGQPFIVDGKPHVLFYKSGRNLQYVNNRKTPFEDYEHLLVSPEYCSAVYCDAIEYAKERR